MYCLYAQLILNNNSKSVDRLYTYGVPDELVESIALGKRVKVKFGYNKKLLDGLVVKINNDCEFDKKRIKPIIDIIDEEVIINENMIKLLFFIRDRYLCKYSDAVRLMVPAQIKFEYNIIIKLTDVEVVYDGLTKKETKLLQIISDDKKGIEIEKVKKLYTDNDLYSVIDTLKQKNILTVVGEEQSQKNSYEKIVSLVNANISLEDYNLKKSQKQIMIVNYLLENKKTSLKNIINELGVSRQIINSLVTKGIVKLEEVLYLDDSKDTLKKHENILNHEQQFALDEIISSDDTAFLLHGVTGSGKTEVYMSIIDYYISLNKQSIMLVPEISLTTQTLERFTKRFGRRVAIFHSKLSKKERFIQWMKVLNREVDVIVGARSALFAPIKNLGVIIVDEEHEDSYKSSSSPKYDGVETAIKRAYIEGAKVVLGTATPSLRTYHMASRGQIKLIELKKRAKAALMPDVEIIDMAKEIKKGNNTLISKSLYDSIKLSLSQNEQVIIFLNRRGYSGFVSCKGCGYVVKCDKCDVSMTYHLSGNMLRCHYCGRTKNIIKVCPECGSDKIELFGAGTQHVEELIKHLFPNASIERMDMDTMNNKESYERAYNNFKNHKTNILIGTQMLAKGFDFPYVTTVGVLSADALLNLPFYTASERTFQLITQVSGRAGRADKKGRVFIQTFEPENYILKSAKHNDFELFANEELGLRKEFSYPPFINIINICTISKNEEELKIIAKEKYDELSEKVKDMIKQHSILLYKPTPHPIYKVNDEYRINLFLKASNYGLNELKDIIRNVYLENDIKNIKISVNINTDSI